ncbi:MAG: response regulator, partial [Spartobacteria bacterium]|nr:response regulator [Spartobacteria bacterium]
GRSFDLSLSVGIATIRPHRDYIETQDILKRADQALYRAKGNGRDRYIIWQDHDAPTPASPPPGALNEEHPATKPLHIMVVDDKPAMTRLIAQFLQELPCEITCAHTVQEALGLLHKNPNRFGIVLTDLTMPDADGFELLDKIHALDKTIVRIVISGYATADNAILAMRHGAYDFIPKPFMPEQLRAVVGRAMEYRRLLSENLQYGQHLEEMVEAKSREASRALEDIKTSYEFTILTMVAMLDARERETSQHSRRVSDLTRLLAYHMGVHDRELDEMGRGALVHDIGKIGIPDNILNKPGPLNEEEWKIMRTHPDIGYQFLRNCSFLRTAAEMVLQHHEAYNGTGYPKGLKGEEISLGARIFMVVDTYDTMRSARVYKKSMPATTVLREIIAQRGRQFDPHVVDALVNHQHEIERAGQWPE